MTRLILSTIVASAATFVSVLAQDSLPATPLASKHFAYPSDVPYQADPDDGTRGTQFGYNQCNQTTENQDSLCQTAFLNHIDDFCVWAPSKPDSTIADTEGEEVAWCSKPGHGTRLIPPGALTGLQFLKSPDYMEVIGFIDQTKINLQADDSGGELDPHGADLRGNPLGGLVYSNGFPSNGGNNDTYQQVIEWHCFMGGGQFCFKVCDPAGPNAANYCQHIFDRIGCAYNAPNNAQNGVFEVCDSDNQDFPGIYTENGQVMTYTQPPESLGAISSMPYTPRVPASSNCVTYQSQELFASLASAFPSSLLSTSQTATASGHAATGNGNGNGKATGASSRTGTGSGVAPTGSANAAMNGPSPAIFWQESGIVSAGIIGLASFLFSFAFLI